MPTADRVLTAAFVFCKTHTDWTAAEEDADDTKQWQDDWDDDDVTGDFSQSLRAEIEKCKAAGGAK